MVSWCRGGLGARERRYARGRLKRGRARRGVRFKSLRLCKRQRAWRRETPGGEWAKPGCRRLSRPQNGGCCVGEGLAQFSPAKKEGGKSQKKASRSPRREKNPDVEYCWSQVGWRRVELSRSAVLLCGKLKQGGYMRMLGGGCWMLDGGCADRYCSLLFVFLGFGFSVLWTSVRCRYRCGWGMQSDSSR